MGLIYGVNAVSEALKALQTGLGAYSEAFEKLIEVQLKRNELMEDALNRLAAKVERDLTGVQRAAADKNRADVAMPINRQPGESKFAIYVGIGQAF